MNFENQKHFETFLCFE